MKTFEELFPKQKGAIIYINDKPMPMPVRGLSFTMIQYVDNSKNDYGEFIGSLVGRKNFKLDNLEWACLSYEQGNYLLSLVDDYTFTVRFPNPFYGVKNFEQTNSTYNSSCEWLEYTMYRGDVKVEPYYIDDTGKPTLYKSIKFNLIDCGLYGIEKQEESKEND